ncbi:MAG: hypothetical protein LIV28_09710 [Lactobacillus sp.]|nr:hypothetical protein [Lactobacillus sp.]
MKVKNKKLYQTYTAVPHGKNSTDEIRNLLNRIAAGDVDYEQDELENLIYAILNNDFIGYQKPKYRVRLNGLVGYNGQQYVTRSKKDNHYFACGLKNSRVKAGDLIQQFGIDETKRIVNLLDNGVQVKPVNE